MDFVCWLPLSMWTPDVSISTGIVCEVLVGLCPLLEFLSFPNCQHLVASFNTSENRKVVIYSGDVSGLSRIFVFQEVLKKD